MAGLVGHAAHRGHEVAHEVVAASASVGAGAGSAAACSAPSAAGSGCGARSAGSRRARAESLPRRGLAAGASRLRAVGSLRRAAASGLLARRPVRSRRVAGRRPRQARPYRLGPGLVHLGGPRKPEARTALVRGHVRGSLLRMSGGRGQRWCGRSTSYASTPCKSRSRPEVRGHGGLRYPAAGCYHPPMLEPPDTFRPGVEHRSCASA